MRISQSHAFLSPGAEDEEQDTNVEVASTDNLLVFGDDNQPRQDRPERAINPPAVCRTSGRPQLVAARATQLIAGRTAHQQKIKAKSKANAAKAVERKNKAVKNQVLGFSKKAIAHRNNLSIKAAGCNKQLKQC